MLAVIGMLSMSDLFIDRILIPFVRLIQLHTYYYTDETLSQEVPFATDLFCQPSQIPSRINYIMWLGLRIITNECQ